MPNALKKIIGEIKISSLLLSEIKAIKNLSNFQEIIKTYLEKSTTEFIEALLAGAIVLDASDLHLEAQAETAKVRVRLDGLLQDVFDLETTIYQAAISRLKLLSGLKLNIVDRPQDGRFSVILEDSPIDPVRNKISNGVEVRSSTLPTEYGETIVLRLLNPKALVEIEALGLRQDLLDILKKEIKRPNGMLIVTGPTGSGKTTTLYAFLKRIQRPDVKIITIEDPIEYHLANISQTQVQEAKGYDFANGLRSIMRQDPDIVLVGEIRDLPTADIALQASLTGHLVLTTLHTNDAVGTVARLVALGAKPSDIGSAINLAIAQRLPRKVCQKCSRLKLVSTPLLAQIEKALKGIPKSIKIPCCKPGLKIPEPVGCRHCNFTGYRGRIGIFEMLVLDDAVETLILRTPTTAALRDLAIKKGMVTLHQDGVIKVLEGITTVEEIERITGE